METNLLTALLIVFILSTVLFVTLFIIVNKRNQTSLNALKDSINKYNELYSLYSENNKLLRSYEITVDNYQNMITTVSDELPKKHDAKSFAMKLADELAPYFIIDDENNKVSISIYKGTA